SLRLLCLRGGDAVALLIELGGHLSVDALPGCHDVLLLLTDGGFSGGDFRLLSGELVLVALARVRDQGCRERLRQLDFGVAGWAGQCWVCHGWCLGVASPNR